MTDATPDLDATGNGRLAAHASLRHLAWAMRSDPGELREHNEDFAAVCMATDGSDRGPLFVVADGLGGHAAGEVASRVATEAAVAHWANAGQTAPAQAVRAAVRSANTAVFDAALETGRRGMGTTMVAATLAGREAIVAHVGDSRAYVVRGDRCTQLTTDHSRVADMVRMKLITPEQAATHPSRSMLTRSLGAEPTAQVDVTSHPIQRGDVLVLCSDGVWDLVSRAELATVANALVSGELHAASEAADRLIDLALKSGAPDNVTAIVVHVMTDEPFAAPAGRRSLFGRRRG